MVEKFPDFIDYIASVAQEFRLIKSLHENGKPWTASCKIAVLTAWGSLRSWICSGHMHENPNLDLNHVYESLAGLPVDVTFISFDDIRRDGIPKDVKVIINCGRLDSAWSGGITGKIRMWSLKLQAGLQPVEALSELGNRLRQSSQASIFNCPIFWRGA